MPAFAVPIMMVMATSAGWVAGGALDGLGAPRGAIIGGTSALVTGLPAAMRRAETDADPSRRVGLLIVVLIAVGAVSVDGGRTAVRVVSAIILAVVIRLIVSAASADLVMMERIADDRPTGTPPDRMRFRVLGFGVLLATIAAYSSARTVGLSDLGRRAVGGQYWAVTVWFGFGILGVGMISLRARRAGWERNGVNVDRGIGQRWVAGVVATALITVAVAVTTPILSGQVSAAPARAISRTEGLDRFFTNLLELIERDGGGGGAENQSDDRDPSEAIGSELDTAAADRPSWIGEVMLMAIIATVFVWAVRLGRASRLTRRRPTAPSGSWEAIRALFADFASGLARILAGLLAWIRGLGRMRTRSGDRLSRVGPSESMWLKSRWIPRGSAERRIAKAFASLVSQEQASPGETPTEVAGRVGASTDPASSGVVLSGYLGARYSPREVSSAQADEVESSLARIRKVRHDIQEDLD